MESFPGQGLFVGIPYFPDPEELTRAFRELVDGKWLTNRGPRVLLFEEALRRRLRAEALEVVTCASATAGLELTLRALELRGKVIVTPLTFAASAGSIVNAGLEPVFIDVDPDTFCLSPAAVEARLSPDIAAVMPVHVYGHVCDVDYFESVRERGVRVIYDAAHAFGVEHRGVPVGHFGDAEVFSFHASKIVNACEGGAIATRDSGLAERLRRMTNFGFVDEHQSDVIGTNAKLSEVHALFGLHSLAHLDEAMRLRLALVARYRERLREIPGVHVPRPQRDVVPNGQFFPILLPNERLRDALYEALKAREIFARRYFHPALHRSKPYAAFADGPLEAAETVAARVMCLPLHPSLREDQIDGICEEISEFLKGAG